MSFSPLVRINLNLNGQIRTVGYNLITSDCARGNGLEQKGRKPLECSVISCVPDLCGLSPGGSVFPKTLTTILSRQAGQNPFSRNKQINNLNGVLLTELS